VANKRAPKVKEPVTYEDFLAKQWEQWGTHHSHEAENIPEPSYKFTVGEKVLFGALHDCVVQEVLEGGKILHLNFHDKGSVYGKPYDAGRMPRLCWWTDVDPLDLESDTTFSRPRLNTNYIQTSLDSLIHMAYHRGINANPDYQRGYVWTLEDKQKAKIGPIVGWPVTEYARLIDATRRNQKRAKQTPVPVVNTTDPNAPYTYEADEVADGRTCRICGLLNGGKLHV